ncbi:hypothetical protein FHT76_007423 [Rhizobium sp. BK176]|nr:hypothetical protein [Rhizobium sp. BK181]MBB3545033.1 hypothetical protein [Rhizobium sp. BK399]MCS3743749.1 hypothetical protein [Rhizobium sp. BK661]MCS4095704.1 hypothetical protein [Rhizobium sp. BK176]
MHWLRQAKRARSARRYSIRQRPSGAFDGLWSVIDSFTGWAVVVREVPLDALTRGEATDLVDLMNDRDLQAREILKRFE